ncbi:MAG: PIN domain-containing protein [Pseudomonadota bacterium]
MTGLTFDTGALIALERRKLRMRQVLERARDRDQVITVPADVVAEWWRGATDIRRAILDSVDIEPLTLRLAQIAGEAMGAVPGATLVDAIVVASAASRGDVIYSSDVHDLERIRRVFPSVRILGT